MSAIRTRLQMAGYLMVVCAAGAAMCDAHPGAINLYVDTTTSIARLAPLPTYEPGSFSLFPGIELSS
ncbi:MAG TPA: hypothetical protein VIY86_14630, partial [Pirellulaceae bacterium]